MIVQDQYSGALHEVPDQPSFPVGEVAYDGLGNPVGLFGPLRNIISNIPIVGGLVNRLLPGSPPGAAAPPPIPTPFSPSMNVVGPAVSSLMQQMGPSMPRPWPLGWIRPQLPYTGLGPRRLYMRCAVWPGPRDLVPGYAANMPPGMRPGLPGFPGMQPGLPGFPGMPMAFAGRRRRRRR
jgi:hypothetical protein